MSTETKTERVLRDVLNSDNLRDFLGEDVVNNAMKWRFLQAALYVLDGHGLLGDPDAVKVTTPAPLDPSKVKAGDTVTLENGETSVRGPVAHIEKALPMDVVLGFSIPNVGWRYIAPGVVAQQEHGVWTLTDHQPAPEPEPEWEPGTVGTATVRGVEGVRVLRSHRTGSVASEFWLSAAEVDGYLQHQDPHVSDFVPDDDATWRRKYEEVEAALVEMAPAPTASLPTRDDLARVMHDDYLPEGSPRLGRTAREELAAAVLRFLRGEVR